MKFLPLVLALSLAMPVAMQAQAADKPAAAKKAPAKKAPAKKPAAKKTAAKKAPVRNKATVKKAVEATTPVESASKRLTDGELAVARNVYTGNIRCELGTSMSVTEDTNNPGFFNVVSGKDRFYMHPVESRTGAVRLEDPRAGAVWLQLGNKSMLMNQRKGERIADNCQTSQQNEVAEAMRREPKGKGLFDN
jgi:Ni/Co efflux regulator RcnB